MTALTVPVESSSYSLVSSLFTTAADSHHRLLGSNSGDEEKKHNRDHKGTKDGDQRLVEKKACKKNAGENGKKKVNKKTDRKNKKKNKKKAKTETEAKKLFVPGQCVAEHKCAKISGDPHIVTFDGLK